jgi:hypothetical protein
MTAGGCHALRAAGCQRIYEDRMSGAKPAPSGAHGETTWLKRQAMPARAAVTTPGRRWPAPRWWGWWGCFSARVETVFGGSPLVLILTAGDMFGVAARTSPPSPPSPPWIIQAGDARKPWSADIGRNGDQTSSEVSRHWRIRLRSIRASSSTLRLRIPCRRAFPALTALPRSVFGPHDRHHGFQLTMSAACRARKQLYYR